MIAADLRMDPRQKMKRAAEGFEENWQTFEQDFWAHVALVESARD